VIFVRFQFAGGFLVVFLVKRIGRKGSLVSSGAVSCIAVACLGTYTLYYEDYILESSAGGNDTSSSVVTNPQNSEM